MVLSAHTHQCGEVWPTKVTAKTNARARQIEWQRTYAFVTGSAYDSRSGYAEEKMYTPLLPAHLCITAELKHSSRKIRSIVFSHEKIEGVDEEFAVPGEEAKWRVGGEGD